jgi:hypothetical protein
MKSVFSAIAAPLVCACAWIATAQTPTNRAEPAPPDAPPAAAPSIPNGGTARTQGPELDASRAQAARAVEARGIARDLALAPESAERLETAYVESRDRLDQARDEFLRANDPATDPSSGLLAIDARERAALERSLLAFLKPDQVRIAMDVLGTFDPNWDRYVDIVSGMTLAEEQRFAVLHSIAKYVRDTDAARPAIPAAQESEAGAAPVDQRKAALDTELRGILDTPQFARWMDLSQPLPKPASTANSPLNRAVDSTQGNPRVQK